MIIEKLKLFSKMMKLQMYALYEAISDPRTPRIAKIIIIVVVAYALSPIDLIPDFIPVIGYLDDIILIPIGVYIAIQLIPSAVWQDCLSKAADRKEPLPKNRLAGLFIVICWIFILSGIIYWLI